MTKYAADMTAEAARFLLQRGVTEESARTFRLGVAADPIPGHEAGQNKLVIPYLSREGYPLTVRFRTIPPAEKKYLSLGGDTNRMFNISALFHATDTIHLTEGEMDAIILHQLGLPAVALVGANGFAPRHARMLAGFSRIWVWGDGDAAGAELVNTVTRRLPYSAKGVQVAPGTDVNDIYLSHGAGALLELTKEG